MDLMLLRHRGVLNPFAALVDNSRSVRANSTSSNGPVGSGCDARDLLFKQAHSELKVPLSIIPGRPASDSRLPKAVLATNVQPFTQWPA